MTKILLAENLKQSFYPINLNQNQLTITLERNFQMSKHNSR